MTPPVPSGQRKWLWPLVAAVVLLIWTAYCDATWMRSSPHLRAVPAFFLGALLLLMLNFVVRLCLGAWRNGWRWLIGSAAWRLCGWTALFVLSTIVLFYNLELWRGKRAWASVVREAERRGEKFSVEAIAPPPVPDEQNFATAPLFAPLLVVSNGVAGNERKSPGSTGEFPFVVYWEHWPFLHGRYGPPPPAGYIKTAPWLEQEKTELRAWMEFWRGWTNEPATSESGEPIVSRAVPDVKPPEAAALLRAGLQRPFEEMLEQLRAYSDRPYCRFPADYRRQLFDPVIGSDVWHAHVLHGFMRILRLRACTELVLGQDEAALRDVQLALRLGDYVRQQPWAGDAELRLNVLVDTLQPVWEGLVEHRWNERQLAALQTQLAGLDVLADYALTVRNDAIAMANLAEQTIPTSPATTRSLPGLSPGELRGLSVVRFFYPTGWSLQDQAAIHRYHLETTSRYFDLAARRIADRPRPNQGPELFATSDLCFYLFMCPKVRELFDQARESFPFAQAAVDLATVACALERYRLAQGEFPATLDALVPKFMSRLPDDIVTGEPLKYRRTGPGAFVLYSVGFDKVDDGGKPPVRYKNPYDPAEPRFNLNQNDWVWTCAAVASGSKPQVR